MKAVLSTSFSPSLGHIEGLLPPSSFEKSKNEEVSDDQVRFGPNGALKAVGHASRLRAGGSAGLPSTEALPHPSVFASAHELGAWCVQAREVLVQTAALLPFPAVQAGPLERRVGLAVRHAAEDLLLEADGDLEVLQSFSAGHPAPALPTAERIRSRLADAIAILGLEQTFQASLRQAQALTRRLPGLDGVLDLPSKLKAIVHAAEILSLEPDGRQRLGRTVRDLQFGVRRCREALSEWPRTRRAYCKLLQAIEQASRVLRTQSHFDPEDNLRNLEAMKHADGVSASLLDLLHKEPHACLAAKTASVEQRTRRVREQADLITAFFDRHGPLQERLRSAVTRGRAVDSKLEHLHQTTGARIPAHAHAFAARQAQESSMLAEAAFGEGRLDDASRHLEEAEDRIARSESDLDSLERFVRKVVDLQRRRQSRVDILAAEIQRLERETKDIRVGQAILQELDVVEGHFTRCLETSDPLAFDDACVELEAEIGRLKAGIETDRILHGHLPQAFGRLASPLRTLRGAAAGGWAQAQMTRIDARVADLVRDGQTPHPTRLASRLVDLVVDAALLQAHVDDAGPDRLSMLHLRGRELAESVRDRPESLLAHLDAFSKD